MTTTKIQIFKFKFSVVAVSSGHWKSLEF